MEEHSFDYHKSFSAKAAMFIQRFNQRSDWSVVDQTLTKHYPAQSVALILTLSICAQNLSLPNILSLAFNLVTLR